MVIKAFNKTFNLQNLSLSLLPDRALYLPTFHTGLCSINSSLALRAFSLSRARLLCLIHSSLSLSLDRFGISNPRESGSMIGAVWTLLCVAARPNGEWGYGTRRHMLEPVRPEAVLPDRALRLPTCSHFLIVDKLLSPRLFLSPPLSFFLSLSLATFSNLPYPSTVFLFSNQSFLNNDKSFLF